MPKDSSELLWDDINRPKFYSLLTCASAGIRSVLYPAALVKTRLQAAGSPAPAMALAGAGTPMAATAAVPHYTSTGNAFATIMRREGKLALYRGFRVNLLGLACDPLVIGFIEYTRTRLTYYSDRMSPLDSANYSSWIFRNVLSPSTAITLVSAGGGACLGQIIQVPVDVITQKKQMQMHPLVDTQGKFRITPNTSSMSIARSIVDAEGLKGLYKGFGVTLGVAAPFTALLWAVYWPTQKVLTRMLAVPTAPAPSADSSQLLPLVPRTHTGRGDHFSTTTPTPSPGMPMTPKGSQPPPLSLLHHRMPPHARLPPEERNYLAAEVQHEFQRELRDEGVVSRPVEAAPSGWSWRDAAPAPMAAFIASASASLATQPIDVIKTRLQVHGGVGSTIASTVRALIKERGLIGLTSGWYSRILVVSPQATIMMSAVEALKRYSAK